MLDRILIPLDGSPTAEAILPQVRRLLLRRESEVLLLRAVEGPPGMGADAPVVLAELHFYVEEKEPGSAAKLEEAVDAFAGLHVSAMGLVAEGDPASEILEACSVHRADLIAMSTHGRSGLFRWVLGSVTEKVLRTATVPMLVVPSTALSNRARIT